MFWQLQSSHRRVECGLYSRRAARVIESQFLLPAVPSCLVLALTSSDQEPGKRNHSPLFNGTACFPLSPRKPVYSDAAQFMSNRGACQACDALLF
jgi:hypothetical protein